MADKEDKNKEIKSQRDLFLAFAFASADLFLEISEDGEICYALGAAQSLTGIDHETLTGYDWLDLFVQGDHLTLITMRKRARDGERQGPFPVKMSEDPGNGRNAIASGIKLPDNHRYHVALAFPSDLTMKMAQIIREQEKLQLLDKEHFLQAADEAFDIARTTDADLDITLLDIPGTQQIKVKLGKELWGQLTDSITEILCANSIDGKAAAQIKEGRYSFIHDSTIDSEELLHQLEKLGRETDPIGKGFEIESKTISADLESLSERETAKALVYTINEFDRKGTNLNIETLNSSFKAYVSANAQRIHQFKTMIEQMNFDISFQPVVQLDDMALSYFEILARFKGETSTQEWITFGEDIGMAADFDIAVCERIINYLIYKASNNRMKFAMNLSGQSIQNEQFFKTLMAKLDLHKDLTDRIIFEITESTVIEELAMVNHFIKVFQEKGYRICLDDFGAGAASLKYLQQLHVNYVKIDGQYTRKVLESERNQLLLKNLARMCQDLKIKTIAEQIEEEAQMLKMKELGVEFGQGYYFGYPHTRPEFDPDNIPARPPE